MSGAPRPVRPLVPEPISADAFAPFGTVLRFDPGRARLVNDGRALRSDILRLPDPAAGRPVLAIYRASADRLPLTLPSIERHPNSSQVFLALRGGRFLTVVAPAATGGGPALEESRAFTFGPGEGIGYRPGVWHAPLRALETDGELLMLIWEAGTPDDCIVEPLLPPLRIEPAP